jgi:quinol monooxygenase YgiN
MRFIVARCYVRPQDAIEASHRRSLMSQVAAWAKFAIQPGKRDEAIAAMQSVLDYVKANEQGTLIYILHTDPKDDDAIIFYELYTDQAAFDAHGKSDAIKAIGPVIGPLLAGRPELKFYTPVQGKGL